jgi:hypothetical protein
MIDWIFQVNGNKGNIDISGKTGRINNKDWMGFCELSAETEATYGEAKDWRALRHFSWVIIGYPKTEDQLMAINWFDRNH